MKTQTVKEFLAAGGKITVVSDTPPTDKKGRPQPKKKYDRKFLDTTTWAKMRTDVVTLADHKCERCDRSNQRLHVHHLTYERYGGEEEPGDLMCLCARCHMKEHGIKRKWKKKKRRKKKLKPL